jgi:hypothetical protein
MGHTRSTYESLGAGNIKRGGGLTIAAMTPLDVVVRQHPEFPSLYTFHCKTLNADITQATCAANYANRSTKCLSCQGCSVHDKDRDGTRLELLNDPKADRHERVQAAAGLDCVRCRRTEATATRHIGRFRLVRGHCLCCGCFNRERECVKGLNSKNMEPRKWAGCLRPTSLVINANGKRKTVDLGWTTGPSEARRHAERRQLELLEIWIDGQRGENMPDTAPMSAKQVAEASRVTAKRVRSAKKPLRVATDKEALSVDDEDPDDYDDKPRPVGRKRLDITGQRFGLLTAIAYDGMGPRHNAVWRFRCDCGNEKTLKAVDVKSGKTKSCGCWRKPRKAPLPPMRPEEAVAYARSFDSDDDEWGDEDELILDAWPKLDSDTLPRFVAWLTDGWPEAYAGDVRSIAEPESDARRDFHGNVEDITGRRFGLLTVIARDGSDSRGHAVWRVSCACGTEKSVRATDLKTGKQISCNCFFGAAIRQRHRNTGPLTESEIAEWNERIGTKQPEMVRDLTWRGRALADIAVERGEDLAVIESRLLATGSPFPDTRKAIRPPPQLVHSEPAVPFEPVADAIAPTAPEQGAGDACELHLADAKPKANAKPAEPARKNGKAAKKAAKKARRDKRAAVPSSRPTFKPTPIAVGTKSVAILAAMGLGKTRILP